MEGFNKFRKKMLIEALLKSALISYSIGTICFAVPYLIMYFMKIFMYRRSFNLIWFIIINFISNQEKSCKKIR